MTAKIFVDTNILVYSVSEDETEKEKRRKCREILASGEVGLSAQVLQEFYSAATRKSRLGISGEAAQRIVDRLHVFPILPITFTLVQEAITLSLRYQISYFDSAILAAANEMECETLVSENLNPEQVYGAVRVVNPFAD